MPEGSLHRQGDTRRVQCCMCTSACSAEKEPGGTTHTLARVQVEKPAGTTNTYLQGALGYPQGQIINVRCCPAAAHVVAPVFPTCMRARLKGCLPPPVAALPVLHCQFCAPVVPPHSLTTLPCLRLPPAG